MKLKKMFMSFILVSLFVSGCSKRLEAQESGVNTSDSITTIAANSEIVSEFVDDENVLKAEFSEVDTANNADNVDVAYKGGFVFLHNGVTVYLGEYTEVILPQLEPEIDYFEMQSCSFDGVVKKYYYDGFEIETYLNNKSEKDRVNSIVFSDDSVLTAEGVFIGQTYDDMVSAYGANYTKYAEIPGFYKYNKNGTSLSFTTQDDVITVISYEVADIYN